MVRGREGKGGWCAHAVRVVAVGRGGGGRACARALAPKPGYLINHNDSPCFGQFPQQALQHRGDLGADPSPAAEVPAPYDEDGVLRGVAQVCCDLGA